MRYRWLTAAVLGAVLVAAALYFSRDGSDRDRQPIRRRQLAAPEASAPRDSKPPVQVGQAAYGDSSQCRARRADTTQMPGACSYHRTMTQVGAPGSGASAPFRGRALTAARRSYQAPWRRGRRFWVTMLEPQLDEQAEAEKLDFAAIGPPRTPQRVVMTTGSHVVQTYWVDSPDGLHQVPWGVPLRGGAMDPQRRLISVSTHRWPHLQ